MTKDIKQEIWKDVVGYEGIYKVSNIGNIKSYYRNKETILKPQKNTKTGYNHIRLCLKDKSQTKTIHIIVCEAFLDYKQSNGFLCINHIDGDKLNNSLSNLEIVTQRENVSKGKTTKNKTSNYIGVCYSKNKWRADIKYKKDSRTIGYFENEIDAKNAYDNALRYILIHSKIPPNIIKTKSKYRGVGFSTYHGKWFSYIKETGEKRIFLGYCNSEICALQKLIDKHLEYI